MKREFSSGGVIVRRLHGRWMLAAIRPDGKPEGLWALPKGTPEHGESIEETARREVSEETGLGVEIVADLGTIEYGFARPAQGVRIEKTVHHFLMRPNGDGRVEDHDGEYDRVEWFAADEALRVMTHRNEAVIVRRALAVIDADAAAYGP